MAAKNASTDQTVRIIAIAVAIVAKCTLGLLTYAGVTHAFCHHAAADTKIAAWPGWMREKTCVASATDNTLEGLYQ